MFTLNDLFDIAIKMEENGRFVYLNALKQTHNSEIESLVMTRFCFINFLRPL